MKLIWRSKVIVFALAFAFAAMIAFIRPCLPCLFDTALDYLYFADLLYHQESMHYSWFVNHRGAVDALTSWTPPYASTFTFEPDKSHTETTVLKINSKTLWVDVTWRDEDHVEISLILDPGATIGRPLDKVGKVQISYSFAYRNKSTSRPPGWIRMSRAPLF